MPKGKPPRLWYCTAVCLATVMAPVAAGAQSAPIPAAPSEATGFLTRADWFASLAGLDTDDPRFSWSARGRFDVDLASYRTGRVNLFADAELVMGSERRKFDLNHENIAAELSSSYRLAGVDMAAVFRHTSRHIVDRAADRLAAWHEVGVRGQRAVRASRARIDVSVEYERVVQHTFVDYTWASQATARIDWPVGSTSGVFAAGSGGAVGVDPAIANRTSPQAGGRFEGGLRVGGQQAGVAVYGAVERRVDGYPLARAPVTWFEAGVRLGSR